VCQACHRAIHEGNLEVYRDCQGRIYWKTKAERLSSLLVDEVKEFGSIPPAAVPVPVEAKVEAPEAVTEPNEEPDGELPAPPEERKPESPTDASPAEKVKEEAEHVVETLVGLGYSRKESRERVSKAVALFADLDRSPTGDEIFNTALRGYRVVLGTRADSTSAECDGRRKGEGPEGHLRKDLQA
jgi:hypothetical protein